MIKLKISALALAAALLGGCGNSQEQAADATDSLAQAPAEQAPAIEEELEMPPVELFLAGGWSTEEGISGGSYVFKEDGTYEGQFGQDQFSGQWKVEGDSLKLEEGTFHFQISGDELVLDGFRYTRDQ